jgi:hypothetical protein
LLKKLHSLYHPGLSQSRHVILEKANSLLNWTKRKSAGSLTW